MNSQSILFRARWFHIALIVGAFLGGQAITAQEAAVTKEAAPDEEQLIQEQQLVEMRRLADTVQVTVGEGKERREVELVEKPLYRFGDLKRSISDGTVWAWGTSGRPILMAEFHVNDQIKPSWGQWLVATSNVPVSTEIVGHGRWSTRETEFELFPVTDMEAPADSEAGRLRQMKRIARSVSASSEWKKQEFQLRLLPTEVHRYKDDDQNLVDGAVFVFAVDSNPEAILFVEAHREAPGEATWKYALARMSAASLSFERNGMEIWAAPQSFGGPTSPHYAFTRMVPPPKSTEK